ncbi:hypothetical protein SAMN05444392_104198 [Seinonella peptonophila]|uniref:Uncharacterized protein n=1 Tax=Seinonella peptonophila TaxID=112248 RepID=A0A1M4X8X0_9BACL|nr:hypothetical protein SAMN05444392_104198 [Seinonella peptonophila]
MKVPSRKLIAAVIAIGSGLLFVGALLSLINEMGPPEL